MMPSQSSQRDVAQRSLVGGTYFRISEPSLYCLLWPPNMISVNHIFQLRMFLFWTYRQAHLFIILISTLLSQGEPLAVPIVLVLPPARTALSTNLDEINMLLDSDYEMMTSLSDCVSQHLDLDLDLVKIMRPLSDITEPLHQDCFFYHKIGSVKLGLLPIKPKLAL